MKTRTCSACGQIKLLNADFFHKIGPERFRHDCIECRRVYQASRPKVIRKAQNATYYDRHRNAIRAKQNAKAATPEGKAAQKERAARHYRANADLYKARQKAWAAAHPDRVRQRTKDVIASGLNKKRCREQYAKHHEKRLAAMKEWRKANPELDAKRQRARYLKKRAYYIAYQQAYWEATTPEQRSAVNFTRNKRRRARVKGAVGKFTWEDYRAILAAQGFRCFYCTVDISDGSDHADHYIPLSRGGTNWPDNIRAACGPCNQSKGNKLPSEFTV